MILYLRCFFANKVALFGVSLLIGSWVWLIFTESTVATILSYLASILAGLSQFGWGTYVTYNEITRRINLKGRISQRYAKIYKKVYCKKVGARLAIKDALKRASQN